MKIILGILVLIMGIFGNVLVFTESATEILANYNINMIYIVWLSVLSIFIGVYNLGRRNFITLNVIGILLNLIFLVGLYY